MAPPFSMESREPWRRQDYNGILSQIKLFLVDEVRVFVVRCVADGAELLDYRFTS